VESASAVSDAPSDASPRVLRESKKLCERGCCLSLINAAGGASSASIGARLGPGRELAGEGSAGVVVAGASGGAVEADRSDFDDAGAANATAALVSEEAEDAAIGAGAVESDAEGVAGIEAEAGVGVAARGPRSSVADADNPKNANNTAHAMASFTRDSFLAAYELARASLRDEVL
jgi:hypothetical protein